MWNCDTGPDLVTVACTLPGLSSVSSHAVARHDVELLFFLGDPRLHDMSSKDPPFLLQS